MTRSAGYAAICAGKFDVPALNDGICRHPTFVEIHAMIELRTGPSFRVALPIYPTEGPELLKLSALQRLLVACETADLAALEGSWLVFS